MTNIQNVTQTIETLKELIISLPPVVTIDTTLTQAGKAADAKIVGDALAALSYTYGISDMTAGVSSLETGKLYFVYE